MLNAGLVVYSTVSGGAEKYLCNLYEGLDERGKATATVVGHLPGWAGPHIPLPLSPKWGRRTIATGQFKTPRERRALASALTDTQFDIFHVQFKREQIAFSQQLARRAPVVWTEHGRFYRGPLRQVLAKRYKRAAAYASSIVCVSEEVADDLYEIVGPGAPLKVIENSVDTRAWSPASPSEKSQARAALGLERAPVLLWVGRLHQSKRAGFAVDLGRVWPGSTVIAGGGPLLSSIRSRAKAIPDVHVLGHVADTAPVYRAADVMAFTSTGAGEGVPTMTILEAIASGVPVVTHEGSAAERVVREAGGIVLPPRATIPDWIEALGQAALTGPSAAMARWARAHDVEHWLTAHEGVLTS